VEWITPSTLAIPVSPHRLRPRRSVEALPAVTEHTPSPPTPSLRRTRSGLAVRPLHARPHIASGCDGAHRQRGSQLRSAYVSRGCGSGRSVQRSTRAPSWRSKVPPLDPSPFLRTWLPSRSGQEEPGRRRAQQVCPVGIQNYCIWRNATSFYYLKFPCRAFVRLL
jgi:hypothetical protein